MNCSAPDTGNMGMQSHVFPRNLILKQRACYRGLGSLRFTDATEEVALPTS